MSGKTLSPCIKVCKFKRQGHCIGCSMTKEQKSLFKKLKGEKHRRAFLVLVMNQQRALGRFTHWTAAYLKRARKKGARTELPR
ncbi:DUF1289 domain-containing protein [Pontivivens insulae]|uniref:DUF1289 domain-containing protein n=1 Tax=Pontivivens insulae TaxID=1639689 RepID=A0A2R8A8W9_9RHOB|nr:DUF1289 domain-containing protein [Pontivivens insulae]RED18773.1 hypothetical protein DFR53_0973 [Pontivivens insulae]SPF28671.1 hypothetical protein POI8812_00974 [Pontivivens insulae]